MRHIAHADLANHRAALRRARILLHVGSGQPTEKARIMRVTLALIACALAIPAVAAPAKSDRAVGKPVIVAAASKKANANPLPAKPRALSPSNVAAVDYQLERDSCCIGN
jgi:hypothetical protein